MSSETDDKPQLTQPVQPSPRQVSADQKLLIWAARRQLLDDVIGFLKWMKGGGESDLGRNPNAEDLLPFFEKYAWSVITTRDKEEIIAASSEREVRNKAAFAIERVLGEICRRPRIVNGKRKPGGIWLRTVKHACRVTAFNIAITEFGEYDSRVFLWPKRQQLRALLEVRTMSLVQEFLARKTRENEAPAATGGAARMRFPERARWFQQRLYERGWGPPEFAEIAGVDAKTIRQILNGQNVRPSTLAAVARAFAKQDAGKDKDESAWLLEIPKR